MARATPLTREHCCVARPSHRLCNLTFLKNILADMTVDPTRRFDAVMLQYTPHVGCSYIND